MTASVAPNETRLPRQVVRQSAAIAARYAPAAAEPENTSPVDATPAPASPPAAAATTASETPAATPAADPRENDPNYWRQRFNVTSGILTKERATRQQERDDLIRKNTELQEQLVTSKGAVPDAPVNLLDFYSQEQIDQYGEEQCRVMATTALKASRATVQAQIDAAVRPLKEQREREAADNDTSRRQKFIDKLVELHPSYPEDDVDPSWWAWLGEENEHGVVRQALLNIHLGNNDAVKTAKMFKDWKATTTVATPPVAPSGSGAGPTGDAPIPNASGLTAPSDAEVKDFYKRSALDKVKDDERVAFEARLKLRNRAG